jgi:hypothetical protein
MGNGIVLLAVNGKCRWYIEHNRVLIYRKIGKEHMQKSCKMPSIL